MSRGKKRKKTVPAKKRVLFLVGSTYQLFGAITLRMTVCRDCECDLLLRSAIQWQEDMLERLRREGTFTTIHRPDFTEIESRFWTLSDEDKRAIMDDPLAYFGSEPVPPVYDELYAALDPIAWKLIYRYHRINGKVPDLYQFDEGTRSYTLDLPISDDKPHFDGAYAETSYAKAIKAFYLHQPELYSVSNPPYPLLQMPNPKDHPEVKEALCRVFDTAPLPTEKHIYFEDYFFPERHITNEMQLFRQLAAIVGQDDLIVKTHPRSDIDRYALLGYKSIGLSSTPWEIQLLANEIGEKVLISISSTAILTPFLLFHADVHVISLQKMFVGQNPFHSDASFQPFFNKLYRKINENKIRFHMPATMEELTETLRFIKATT